MAEKHEWYLFYIKVSHIGVNLYAEIKYKGFEDEIDLLVWASEMHIPKKLGLHWVVSKDGISRMPVDLYERIEVLKKDRVHREALKEERTIAKKEQMLRERRQARKQKQTRLGEVCNT